MPEVKAPKRITGPPNTLPKIFLAGSIEMGTAVDWQRELADSLSPYAIVLNPRRDDWDSSWAQTVENVQFTEQVMWELRAMEEADLILMYFAPSTKSPITLLELGLNAKGETPIIVCCPDEFWRKGNVEITCARYDVPMVATLGELDRAAFAFARTFG